MTRMIDPTELSGARAGQRSQERRPDTADVYLLARQMQADAIARTTQKTVAALARLIARAARGSWRALVTLRARRRTVAELSQLDDRALADIGIDPHDIAGAVDRLFAGQGSERTDAQADRNPESGATQRPADLAPAHGRARPAAPERTETPANTDGQTRRKAA
ncbi:hypothetical protein CKO28_17595 [Rhodovibrio sodomensis]|uniref:YjiS-like domain-containing protein n=1 Tax=Rhodovibrio sodomensis TaxID=1088 RepID=A0ABS1DHT8_9PROT|nr:DUF1127 domain-containing protein [Rhodovibrio sodomensis]MBK1669853.1 hypothetical protein [Rhodovibrio sodomensis]